MQDKTMTEQLNDVISSWYTNLSNEVIDTIIFEYSLSHLHRFKIPTLDLILEIVIRQDTCFDFILYKNYREVNQITVLKTVKNLKSDMCLSIEDEMPLLIAKMIDAIKLIP